MSTSNNKSTGFAIAGFAALLGFGGIGYTVFQTSGVKVGQRLYQENCASCHGANREGQPDWQSPDENGILPAPPHNSDGHTWHHGDGMLFSYIKYGGAKSMEMLGVNDFASGMPSFEIELSDKEIQAVLSYLKSNWTAQEQAYQSEQTQAELKK